jgi:hypothetical protein
VRTELAQLAYRAYVAQRVDSDSGNDLTPGESQAWEAAAGAVLDATLAAARIELDNLSRPAPGRAVFQSTEAHQRATGVSRRAIRDLFKH